MEGNCKALAEADEIMAEAVARPFPVDSWDSSMGNHPINIAEVKEFPLPADSWDSSMGNHSIIASTASELPTTESTTPTEGNTAAPTMPKGETSSGINEGISPLHLLHL